jgi:hypothetical protein
MRSPYKGLTPYTEEDRPYFFGRDAEREIVAANLKASRLTILYGASGVGKSSVLRAGVLHDINAEAARYVKRGRQPEFIAAYCQDWRENLTDNIAAALRLAWTQVGLEPPVPPALGLRALLASHAGALKAGVLLILDQFEEYLFYQSSKDGPESMDLELVEVLADRGLRTNILISLREDALAKLDQFKGRINNFFDNNLRIDHLDQRAAREAIVRPVETFCRLENVAAVEVEPSLVDAVIEQVRTGKLSFHESTARQAGTSDEDRVETPYLQLVLSRIWDEEMTAESKVLRRDTLRRLGESSSIVKNHLDTTLSAFTEAERQAAERVFFHLVTPSRTKIAHTVSDLAAFANLDEACVQNLVTKLAAPDYRILRAVPALDSALGSTRYEIYHDALADAILDWQARFRAGVKRRQLEAELAERARQDQERREREREAERGRRQRRLAAASLAVALVCLGLAATAVWYGHLAHEEEAVAAAQRGLAEQARLRADQQRTAAERATTLAEQSLERIRKTLEIRKAALGGDQEHIKALLGTLQQNTDIKFRVTVRDLQYKNSSHQETYDFRMFPAATSLPQGKDAVALITYLADSPAFRNRLITAGPLSNFTAGYIGWGCLSQITALVEYVDPERPPTVSIFDMCALAEAVSQ